MRFGEGPTNFHHKSRRPNGTDHPETNGTSFTFLGFTHIWGKSRAGKNVVRQVTAKNRFARALAAVGGWCSASLAISSREAISTAGLIVE
jgi:RNA-directed DNA polymerase